MDKWEKTCEDMEFSIRLGIEAEEDWEGPSIKPGEITDAQVSWLSSWLIGEGWKNDA